jgi:TRAP-type C4-dicarboxylate transport system permease small subunit
MKDHKLKTKFFKWSLDKIEGYLMLLITTMLVIDVLLGILARFIHFEIVFATELGKYLFIWLCLLGISAAAKDNQHIRISFIVERLPVSQKTTWILSQVIFLIFSLLFFYVGLRLTWMHFIMTKSTVGFNFPMFVFTAALPVGFFLTSWRLIQDIINQVRGSGKNRWGMDQAPAKGLGEQGSSSGTKRM